MHPRAQLPNLESRRPHICSRHADSLAQNLTLRVRSIGPRHMGHRGGVLDIMSSAHDSQAHCMHKKGSTQSAQLYSTAHGKPAQSCKMKCSLAAHNYLPVIRQGKEFDSGAAAGSLIAP